MNAECRIAKIEWTVWARRDQSFDLRHSRFAIRSSFTLIELVVVLALMSTAFGLVVFRLDGFTEVGRLRSAGGQLAAWVGLAQSEAVVSGVPRLVRYDLDTARLVIHSPTSRVASWSWDEGAPFDIGGGVHVQRVVREHPPISQTHEASSSVRVDPEGRFPAHAVVLALHERVAVLILRAFAEPRLVLAARPPQAQEFDLLLSELAGDEYQTKR